MFYSLSKVYCYKYLKYVSISNFYGCNFFYFKYYSKILKILVELELYLYYFYKFNLIQQKFLLYFSNNIIINIKSLIKKFDRNLKFLYFKLEKFKKFKKFFKLFIFFNFYILKYPYKSSQYIIDLIKINLNYNKSLKTLINIIYFNILYTFNNIKYNLIFKGLKLKVSGRINKSEKSFSETFIKGNFKTYNLKLPIQIFKTYLNTKYGLIGFKLWLLYLIRFKNV